MKYKKNLNDTVQRMDAYFHGIPLDRPMVKLLGKKDRQIPFNLKYKNLEEKHIGVEYNVAKFRNFCENHEFLLESAPIMSLDLGAGSMAAYLGCEPVFHENTVWFNSKDEELEDYKDLVFNPENIWWKKHCDALKKAVQLSNGDFFVAIPDIIENLDILSAMRGPQNLCYDMIDYPELIHKYVNQIDDLYFQYYDNIYNIVKTTDNVSAYTVFPILGHGKIAKIQCDHSSLISPDDFKEFVVPSLTKQANKLDGALYHLDGKDAVRHLDSILEIKNIGAVQWTPGAGNPDGGSSQWYPLYDKIHEAGKGLWIALYDGTFEEMFTKSEKIIKRYGNDRVYFIYRTPLPMDKALNFKNIVETKWSRM